MYSSTLLFYVAFSLIHFVWWCLYSLVMAAEHWDMYCHLWWCFCTCIVPWLQRRTWVTALTIYHFRNALLSPDHSLCLLPMCHPIPCWNSLSVVLEWQLSWSCLVTVQTAVHCKQLWSQWLCNFIVTLQFILCQLHCRLNPVVNGNVFFPFTLH